LVMALVVARDQLDAGTKSLENISVW
jgi:hypothetical protein